MRLPPRKKKIFLPVFPSDPVGAEFCKWFWQFNRGWDWIVGNCPSTSEKTRWRKEPFPIQPDELWQRHQAPEEAIGVCFKKFTRYMCLDIDSSSAIHPDNNPTNYAKVLEALREIGLIEPVIVRSTWSEGLHIYYPLPKPLHSFSLACAVKWTLFAQGIVVTDGQIELFPNVKSYGKDGKIIQFKSHRLPLQPSSGSFLLDATLEPYSDSVEDLLDEFKMAAAGQDLKLMKAAMAACQKQEYLALNWGSNSGSQWKRHLESRVNTGWTAFSQTNSLIKDIATYGRVFVRLDGRALIDYTVQTVTSAPGYEQFCRHQHEIRRRVEDWSRCVEAYYWPYGSEPSREGTYAEHFHREPAGDCPPVKNNIVSFNATRSAQAIERIRQAVAHLEESGNLPSTATARSYAIIAASKQLRGIGISQTTLHKPKYLPIWHPDHYHPQAEKCVIDCHKPNAAVCDAREFSIVPDPWLETESPQPSPQQALSENYTSTPYMKGLCLPCLSPASDEPQAQSDALDSENSSPLKFSEEQTHKEIKCQEKSGAVEVDDNSALSVESPEIDPTPNDATPTPVETAPAIPASAPAPAPAVTPPDALTPLTALDHKQIAMLRLQAIVHAQREVKIQALTSGRLKRGIERTHLEQVQRMQFYWRSGSELLRAEARAWAAANPGFLPEIDQLDPDQIELSPPASPCMESRQCGQSSLTFSSTPEESEIIQSDKSTDSTIKDSTANEPDYSEYLETPDPKDFTPPDSTELTIFDSMKSTLFADADHQLTAANEGKTCQFDLFENSYSHCTLGSTVIVDWFDPEKPCPFHGKIGRITKIDGDEAELDIQGMTWRPYLPLNKLKLHHS